jgi:hypothetical protein
MRYTLLLSARLVSSRRMCSCTDDNHVCDTGNDNNHLHAGHQYNCLEPAGRLSTKLPTDLRGASHHHNRISHPIRNPPHLAGQIGGMADTGFLG